MGIIKENQWPNEPRGSTVFPVIYKRMSFAFENELRLIHINVPVTLGINEGLLPGGKRIKVDLDEMIVKVHLSPYSEKWFQELVEGLMEKYSLGHKPTARSDLFSSLK